LSRSVLPRSVLDPETAAAPVRGRRHAALAALLTMQLMVALDVTVVSVALPNLKAELGFSAAGLSWVVNAYLIAFAGLLLLSGRLGDLIGPKRMFMAGTAVFTAASVVCALAATPAMLVAGRFVQGIGAAMASAVILAMLVRLFPDPGEQARAMGAYGFTRAAGALLGLAAGGVLTQMLGWEAAFWINTPIGLAALVLAARFVEATPSSARAARPDVIGAILVTAGLSLGVYAIVLVGEPNGTPLAWGAVSVVLLAAFLVRQAKIANPLMPLRLFHNRSLAAGNAAFALLYAAAIGFQFMTALYLQQVLGLSAMETGLAFVPTPLGVGVTSLVFNARLIRRFGAAAVMRAGLVLLVVGLPMLALAPTDGNYWTDVLPALVILGIGQGMAMPATMMLSMSGVPAADRGLASGLNNTAQQVGGAVGLSVMAVAAVAVTADRGAAGLDRLAALHSGYAATYWIQTGFVLAAFVLATVLLRAPKR
jgi:EmrB/QacA subfamily drug resistance transporter